jgi:hypothetical protein
VASRGNVFPDIQVEPADVSFGPGEAGPKSVKFTPGRMKDFRLKRAYGTHQGNRITQPS